MPEPAGIPHDSWAEVYDEAYEKTFGGFYDSLSTMTITLVLETIRPPARIVDFGAGTGRLAIPLSKQGFQMDAVDPSSGMLEQLRGKDPEGSVSVHRMRMEEFRVENEFDLALCVFTVLLYLLNEDALEQSLEVAFRSLKPGGRFLIDVPSRGIFRSFSFDSPGIERRVTVDPEYDDLFTYREELTITGADGKKTFTDKFQIRNWPVDKVVQILKKTGFELDKDFSPEFRGSGSQYFLMKKPSAKLAG